MWSFNKSLVKELNQKEIVIIGIRDILISIYDLYLSLLYFMNLINKTKYVTSNRNNITNIFYVYMNGSSLKSEQLFILEQHVNLIVKLKKTPTIIFVH